MGILAEIRENPYLSERFALQGGTALHLFHLGLLRLSVDIDLIYTGAVDRETLAAERPQVLGELEGLLRRLGYEPGTAGREHAGTTYKLRYEDDGRWADSEVELEEELYPLLATYDRPDLSQMLVPAGAFLRRIAALSPEQAEYLRLLDEESIYRPELLFSEWPAVLERARVSPAAAWKVENLAKRPGK